MSNSVHPSGLDVAADDDTSWENERPPLRIPTTAMPAAPMLHLDGFDGPLDLLLNLVERQHIDLGRMSMLVLIEKFVVVSDHMRDRVPIKRRTNWLVIVSRFVLLHSRPLFP